MPVPIAVTKPWTTSSWISASPDGCRRTEAGSFKSSTTFMKRSRASLKASPRSRSTPMTARRSRSNRVIELGPRPNWISATAVSGMALPSLLETRSCSSRCRSARVTSVSMTRMGISRSPTVYLARLKSASPIVATRIVSAICSGATPSRAASSRPMAASSSAPLRDSIEKASSRSPRSFTYQARLSGISPSLVAMMPFSCFCDSVRSDFGTSVMNSAALRTSSRPVGDVPPSTKTCLISGMVFKDLTMASVVSRV